MYRVALIEKSIQGLWNIILISDRQQSDTGRNGLDKNGNCKSNRRCFYRLNVNFSNNFVMPTYGHILVLNSQEVIYEIRGFAFCYFIVFLFGGSAVLDAIRW